MRKYNEVLSTGELLAVIAIRTIAKGITAVLDTLYVVYKVSMRLLSSLLPKYEYYLCKHDGSVKKRRFTGNKGVYKYFGSKLVKIQDAPSAVIDEFTNIGWKEAEHSGQYDPDLGYVGSKQEYRQKMKEKGFVPYQAGVKPKPRTQDSAKQRQYEQAFKQAVQRAESQFGVNFN